MRTKSTAPAVEAAIMLGERARPSEVVFGAPLWPVPVVRTVELGEACVGISVDDAIENIVDWEPLDDDTGDDNAVGVLSCVTPRSLVEVTTSNKSKVIVARPILRNMRVWVPPTRLGESNSVDELELDSCWPAIEGSSLSI